MNKNTVETVLGAVVLLIAGSFLAFAYKTADLKPKAGYELFVRYTSTTDGLHIGSDVRIKGVKIGKVIDKELTETETGAYHVMVKLNIQTGIELSLDTSAKIKSESLLGGNYLALSPGADELMLEAGDTIEYAASATNLEEVLSKAVAGLSKE